MAAALSNVVFLVKNGIGFGHIRRALIIAEVVQTEGWARPIVVSQASSLALYQRTAVRVINFPLLHRVSSAVAEDRYIDVLNRVLDGLDPAVVVEDTYPDARYDALPALAGRPRILVVRRLDGLFFDTLRRSGRFRRYDRVLILQDEAGFGREAHSGDSLAVVARSGWFEFVGNVCQVPSPADVATARERYVPDTRPLVVVNAGAGGDQMPDGYSDRLFSACATVAQRLAESSSGSAPVFVLVVGPYYAGGQLHETGNVIVSRFEPDLDSLVAAADVAVIKPGNNVLSEALLGRANLILVPDVSFMEGVNEHAARVVAEYGGTVVKPEVEALDAAIRYALSSPPRTLRAEPNPRGLDRITETIRDHLGGPACAVPAKRLLLAFLAPKGVPEQEVRDLMPATLDHAVIVNEHRGGTVPVAVGQVALAAGSPSVVLKEPPDFTPRQLVEAGPSLVIATTTPVPAALTRWLAMEPTYPSLAVCGATAIRASHGQVHRFARQLRDTMASTTLAIVIVDLSALPDTEALKSYLTAIGEWLATQPIELTTPQILTATISSNLLEAV